MQIVFSKIKNGVWAELSSYTMLKVNQARLKSVIFSIYVIIASLPINQTKGNIPTLKFESYLG